LPDDGWRAWADGTGEGPLAGPWTPGGAVAHVFTHFSLTLNLALYSGSDWASLPAGCQGEWWPLDRLEEAGLPTLFAKAARLALAGVGER
jgi:A/G-specific adenine glycosylase